MSSRSVILNVSNVDTEIRGVFPVEELDTRLSYGIPGAWFNPLVRRKIIDGKVHLLEGNKFPSGLLSIVCAVLTEAGYNYTIKDSRIFPKKFGDHSLTNGKELRSHQMMAVAKILKHFRGVIQIPPGGGKTLVAAAAIRALNVPTMFVVHTKTLLSQTYDEFREVLPEVGMVGSGKREWKKVTIANVQSLMSCINRGDTKVFDNYKALFIDECHHVSSNGQKASWFISSTFFHNASVRIGLSATPVERKRGMLLVGACGEIIHKVPESVLQERGFLAESKSIFYEIDKPQIDIKATYLQAYAEGVIENDERNEIAVNEAIKYGREGNSVMMFVDRIEHGETLQMLLEEKHAGVPFVFLSGLNPREEIESFKALAKNREVKILIVTRKLFGEGVDIPVIDVVINLGAGKDVKMFKQMFGRGLRIAEGKKYLLYIDFYDKTHRHLRAHSEERMKHCRQMKQPLEKRTYVSRNEKDSRRNIQNDNGGRFSTRNLKNVAHTVKEEKNSRTGNVRRSHRAR